MSDNILLNLFFTKISAFFLKYGNIYKAYKIQNKFDLDFIRKAKVIVIFFIPPKETINGGILSIFSLCTYTKKVYPSATTLIATFPGKKTHAHNHFFHNNEDIYRWEQIVNNARNVEHLILHIPEYLSSKFYISLKNKDKKFLKSVHCLHINIMNQNIELMPNVFEIKKLYRLTNNITQTLAFSKNLTQGLSDLYKMPVHLFSTWLDYSEYTTTKYTEKEKIIVVSPDDNMSKKAILEKIANELKDYRIVVIENLKFDDYMQLISKAFAVITFGEGFDWFFMQPPQVGTLSFSVFNEKFFPDKTWKNLQNVFDSYEELHKNIVNMIKKAEYNKIVYYNTVNETLRKISDVYSEKQYTDNLDRFYKHKYDLLPNKG